MNDKISLDPNTLISKIEIEQDKLRKLLGDKKSFDGIKFIKPFIIMMMVIIVLIFLGFKNTFLIKSTAVIFVLAIIYTIIKSIGTYKNKVDINKEIDSQYKKEFVNSIWNNKIEYNVTDIESLKLSKLLGIYDIFRDNGHLRFNIDNKIIDSYFFETIKRVKTNDGIENMVVDNGAIIKINNFFNQALIEDIVITEQNQNKIINGVESYFKSGGILKTINDAFGIDDGDFDKLIDFENPEFNEKFNVISKDENFAYKIMTLDLIDRILNFKNYYNEKMKISYVNTDMYIYLENLNYFSYDVLTKGIEIDKEKTIKFNEILEKLSEIIEDLGPNKNLF